MKYYTFVELVLRDSCWILDYANNVTRLVERFGGKYLARTDKVSLLEGSRPTPEIVIIIEWPSKEAASRFYESAEYQPLLRSRTAGATNNLLFIAGEDVTKLARIER